MTLVFHLSNQTKTSQFERVNYTTTCLNLYYKISAETAVKDSIWAHRYFSLK